jgi:hypothetical protein
MPVLRNKLEDLAGRALMAILARMPAVFIVPGDAVARHRDDEDDFDVVCGPARRPFDTTEMADGIDGAEVNRTPIEPVIAISAGSHVADLLKHGVQIGDFTVAPDGSIEPIVPDRGEINHTWVRVLIAELMLATGSQQSDPDFSEAADHLAEVWCNFLMSDFFGEDSEDEVIAS